MSSESTDQQERVKPFLGKAREIPQKEREVLFDLIRNAPPVEVPGLPVLDDQVCPVPGCKKKISGGFVGVKLPYSDDRGEVLPRIIAHLVTAHDYWHPTMQVFLGPVDEVSSKEGSETPSKEPEPDLGILDESWSDLSALEQVEVTPFELPFPARPSPRILKPSAGRPVPRPVPPSRSAVPRPRRQPEPATRPPRQLPAVLSVGRSDLDAASRVAVEQICKVYAVDKAMAEAVVRCAQRCGAVPADVANWIHFISRWNAPIGDRVGPMGLTAPLLGRLGLSLSDYQSLDAAAQIEKAGEVIRVWCGRTAADTPAKLYLSILYPDAVFWPPHQRWAPDAIPDSFRRPQGEVVRPSSPYEVVVLVEERALLKPSVLAEQMGVAPSSSSEEGNLFGKLSNWMTGLFGGAAPEQNQQTASWTCPPSLQAVLVDSQGRSWGPGTVPAGTYQLQMSGQVPKNVMLEPQRKYRASSVGHLFDVVDSA